MAQDSLIRAKEKHRDAKEAFREMRAQMLEDLKFSNPAKPEQWEESIKTLRAGRPCLTFDQTNQYIAQVVNDSRQNKPSIHCLPSDANGAIKVAQALEGIVRNVEYASRASIAYDTAQEHAARIGLGWIRITTEIVDEDKNEQEPRILRVHDPLSVLLDVDSVEPDGSDATDAFVETTMSKKVFEKMYPKMTTASWDTDGWFTDDSVRICEHFYTEEITQNRIMIRQDDGSMLTLSEDEYWQLAQQIGYKPPVAGNFKAKSKRVKWEKMTGAEILEQQDFPSQYIPVVPVLGYELWIEGKRSLCGMVRRMRDSQMSYNYERSAQIERIALEPKAPWVAAIESIEGFEDKWAASNTSNQACLTFNAFGENGEALPQPKREGAPQISTAFANAGQQAINDLQASIGMYKSNLGAQSNAVSGRAKMADQRQGDTANFHYIDNLSRSIEQVGRIIIDIIPRIIDTKRAARILNMDGTNDTVIIDPSQEAAHQEVNGKTTINLSSGRYDVRVKAGPAYSTLRQEAAQNLTDIVKSSPQMMSILGPMWAKMQDWPEADKISRMLMAMAPPQVQQAANDKQEQIPPQAQAQIQQLSEQLQQAGKALETASEHVDKLESGETIKMQELQLKAREISVKEYEAETKRMQASVQPPEPVKPTNEPSPDAVVKAQTDIEIANINASKEIQLKTIEAQGVANDGSAENEGSAEDSKEESDMQLMIRAVLDSNAQVLQAITAPRVRQLVRDENGRADHTIETISGM